MEMEIIFVFYLGFLFQKTKSIGSCNLSVQNLWTQPKTGSDNNISDQAKKMIIVMHMNIFLGVLTGLFHRAHILCELKEDLLEELDL